MTCRRNGLFDYLVADANWSQKKPITALYAERQNSNRRTGWSIVEVSQVQLLLHRRRHHSGIGRFHAPRADADDDACEGPGASATTVGGTRVNKPKNDDPPNPPVRPVFNTPCRAADG